MTTYEYATVRGRSALSRLVDMLRPALMSLFAVMRRAWGEVRPVAMTTCGLGCITAGLFTVSVLAGLIGAGISFFIVDYAAEKRR